MAGKKHTVRHRDGGVIEVDNYSPTKAIKLFCSECMGWEANKGQTLKETIADCPATKCPLYALRGASTPERITSKQRAVRIANGIANAANIAK